MGYLSGEINAYSQTVSKVPFGFQDGAYDTHLQSQFAASATPSPPIDIVAAKTEGYNFALGLLMKLEENPNYFKNFTTRQIAETLRQFNQCNLNESDAIRKKVLVPLYMAYDPTTNHVFRSWDMDCRIKLMEALIDLPVGDADQNEDGRFNKLVAINQIAAGIYGFLPDTVEPVVRPPTVYTNGSEIVSNGSRDRTTRSIFINTYMPSDQAIRAGKIIPRYHHNITEAVSLTLHEGRHTFQDALDVNDPRGQEFRDVATIMKLSAFGDYYLNNPIVTNATYRQNPTEKDAYEFEGDMHKFVSSSTEMRRSLIEEMKMRRDYHLSQIPSLPQTSPQTYTQSVPNMAFGIAC